MIAVKVETHLHPWNPNFNWTLFCKRNVDTNALQNNYVGRWIWILGLVVTEFVINTE